MLSLDEAIVHCEQKAKELKAGAEHLRMSEDEKVDCVECATEHQQLAEWLKQLKYLQSSSSYAELTALRKFKAENERPRKEWVRKEDVIHLLEKWADGYSYIELPTEDAIKAIKDMEGANDTD